MEQLIVQVVGGLLVVVIAAWLGIGNPKTTFYHAGKPRKTGKWIMLISALMIIGGLAWMGSSEPKGFADWLKPPALYGFTLFGYGVIFFIVGKVVAWFQRP